MKLAKKTFSFTKKGSQINPPNTKIILSDDMEFTKNVSLGVSAHKCGVRILREVNHEYIL